MVIGKVRNWCLFIPVTGVPKGMWAYLTTMCICTSLRYLSDHRGEKDETREL